VVRVETSAGGLDSDWSLLERVVRKDEAALSELYDRYSGLVFSEAKRILRDTQTAEEILQDLFYQIWRTAERFDASRWFRFLFTRISESGFSRFFWLDGLLREERKSTTCNGIKLRLDRWRDGPHTSKDYFHLAERANVHREHLLPA
jgi:hypothetical protein